ncbi:MAG TPA: hypothetical protein VGK35_06205, partial [Actinotalea sp.]
EQPAPDGLDDLAGWLLAGTGVALVDGSACGRAGRGFVRLNLAMPRPLVVEAGRRIGARLEVSPGGSSASPARGDGR